MTAANHPTNDASVAARTLVMERIFDAPRELVFKAYTDPKHLEQWFGPRGWTTTVYALDLRPDGIWHYCMRSADGEESWGKGIYREIVPPERIAYLDIFSDKDGNSVEGMPQMEIVVEFHEQDGKTKLISRTVFATPDELKAVIDMGVEEGAAETFDRLEEFLAQERGSA